MTVGDLAAATQTPQDWDKLTKAQLKVLRFQGETTSESTMTKDAGTGDSGVLTEVTKDLLTGTIVGRGVTRWTYYPTGEVDEIAGSDFDAQGKETKRPTIKHYKDGRQPFAREMMEE